MTKAINKCHVCGQYYCKTCLIEGAGYYFCKQPECLKVLEGKLIAAVITCPSCSNEIALELAERTEKKFHCPICEKYINMNVDPPKILDPLRYIYLLTTINQTDIAFIKSILDSEKIEYFITGQNFLSVDPLIQGARLYVDEKHYQLAKDLIDKLDLHVFAGSTRIE
jgi:hypothetical protein